MTRTTETGWALVGLVAITVAITSACASTPGSRPQPFPMPPTARISHAPAAAPATTLAMTAKEAAIIDTALHLRGTPYRNGGSTPNGFDCSGFTQWVFAQHGLALPREVKDQFRAGTSINVRSLAPGDLVFFKTTASTASHVGIVLGPDTFVHAPSSRGVVRIEHLTSAYWTERLVGVRRVLQTN